MFVKIKKYSSDRIPVKILRGLGLDSWADNVEQRMDENRYKVRINYCDIWDANNTLAYIILPVLVKLKENKNGAPFVDSEDVPEHLRATSEELEQYNIDGSTDSKFFDRWDWMLDEMIYAFKSYTIDWEEGFYEDGKFSEEGFKKEKEELTRIERGTTLFGKYYSALWD